MSSALHAWGIRSVAVFRALRLGDMLCAVPALRALRAGLPHARITLVGMPWAEAFVRRFDRYIDGFIAFPGHPSLPEQAVRKDAVGHFYRGMRLRRFDLAVQLHGDGRFSNAIVGAFGAGTLAGFRPSDGAAAHRGRFLPYPQGGRESARLAQLARFLGMPVLEEAMEFPLHAADYDELARSGLAAPLGNAAYACIHPGASRRDKCWHPEGFAAVGDRLVEDCGLRVVLTGSAAEKEIVAEVARRMRHPAVEAAAPVSVGALAALMKGARLLVCNDTGVSHIAAGLRLPSVVIFSNSDIERWAPLDGGLHSCVLKPGAADLWLILSHARRLLRTAPSSRAS